MPPIKRPANDLIELTEFYQALEDRYSFVVDTEIAADAMSYELPNRSLKRYCFLLAPIRPGESFGDEWRIMGLLWHGKRYHHDIVIEVFGKGIEDHMHKIARRMQRDFGDEVQVLTRTLITPRYK